MSIPKTEKIWHNGKLINWDDAKLHVMSHVVNYGSSVFEGVRCYKHPQGPAIFRAQEHAERLLNSAKIYRMDVPFTEDEIVQAMIDVVGHNGVYPCYIRPIVLRGYGEAGVNPFNSPIEVYICNYAWGKYLGHESADEGVDVCVSAGDVEVRRELHEFAAHQDGSHPQRIRRRHRTRREWLRQRRLGREPVCSAQGNGFYCAAGEFGAARHLSCHRYRFDSRDGCTSG